MKRRSVLRPFYLTLVLVFLYLPLVFVVLFSFNPSKNAGVMTGFTLDWYAKLFRNASLVRRCGPAWNWRFGAALPPLSWAPWAR